MALTAVSINFDLHQLLGADFDPRRTKGYVKTNIANQTIQDTSTGETRIGDQSVEIASDGTGSWTTWAPEEGVSNPASWQETLVIDYPRTGQRDRQVRRFGPYTLSAANDGDNITDLEDEQAVPAEYLTSVTTTLDGYVTDAETARTGAETAQAGAEAARDTAVDISGISTSDGVVTALENNPASAFRVANDARLTATTVRRATTFTGLAGSSIPTAVTRVQTDGYSTAGIGAAYYIYDAAVDAAYVTANPRTSFQAAGGRGFRLSAAWPTPEMAGALGDGVNDDTPAIQALLDLKWNIFLRLKRYLTVAPLVMKQAGQVMQGTGARDVGGVSSAGGTRIVNNTGSMFTQGSAPAGVTFRDIGFTATAGHIFDVGAGNCSGWGWRRCDLVQQSTAHSIISVTTGAFDGCQFDDNTTSHVNATVPSFSLVTSTAAILNSNLVNGRHVGTGATAPVFHLESTAAGSYVSNIKIKDWSCLQSGGGLVRLRSCQGTVIDNVNLRSLGATPTTAHLFDIGKNATAPTSTRTTIRNCQRQSSTALGGGFVDIYLRSCTGTLIEQCDTGTGSGFAIDMNYQSRVTIIGCDTAVITNQSTNAAIIGGSGYGFNPGSGQGGGVGGAIQTGTGVPVGAGVNGDIYVRADGSATAPVLYQRRSGNWVALTTQTMTATSTSLDSIAAAINTTDKYTGKQVFNVTTNKTLTAQGGTAGALWVDAMGTTAHTPA